MPNLTSVAAREQQVPPSSVSWRRRRHSNVYVVAVVATAAAVGVDYVYVMQQDSSFLQTDVTRTKEHYCISDGETNTNREKELSFEKGKLTFNAESSCDVLLSVSRMEAAHEMLVFSCLASLSLSSSWMLELLFGQLVRSFDSCTSLIY